MTEPVVQDTFIMELYEPDFWSRIREEQRIKEPTYDNKPVYLGWDKSIALARIVYDRVNDSENPVRCFVTYTTNTLMHLTNPKILTTKSDRHNAPKMISTLQKFLEKTHRVPEQIFNNKQLIACSLFYALTNSKTREKIKKEMEKSIWKDEDKGVYREGYSKEQARVIAPCPDKALKVLRAMEMEENTEKMYATAWKKSQRPEMKCNLTTSDRRMAAEPREDKPRDSRRRRDSSRSRSGWASPSRTKGCFRCAGDSSSSRSRSRSASKDKNSKKKDKKKKRSQSNPSATSASGSRSRSGSRGRCERRKGRRDSVSNLAVSSSLMAESASESEPTESEQDEPRKKESGRRGTSNRSQTPARPSKSEKGSSRRSGGRFSRHAR